MKKINYAFEKIPMTWPRVCAYAIIIGVYVGIINQIPILNNTSFSDIAVTCEWWVLFAIVIVSNCKTAWEAGIKCLIFFFISQPIIYIVELPTIGLHMALYYWIEIWLPISILTLPGGIIAFFVKKQNIAGAIILGIGNTFVALMGVSYFFRLNSTFPRHLLTVASCVMIIFATIWGTQKKKWTRILSVVTTAILTIVVITLAILDGRVI